MSLLNEETLRQTAREIAPHIDRIIRTKGQIDIKDYRELARKYATHKIRSERSCQIVDEYITEGTL